MSPLLDSFREAKAFALVSGTPLKLFDNNIVEHFSMVQLNQQEKL
jgi:hypothetical protein